MPVVSGESTGTVEVTPSGIPVYYQSRPKRLYKIGPKLGYDATESDLLAQARNPHEDLLEPEERWREVPSVTTVLDVLAKPALPWWGMRVGVEGVKWLCEAGAWHCVNGENNWWSIDTDTIVEHLTEHKLTVNHVRDKAGSRGQSVHDALETWAKTGHKPDPNIYPPEEKGYIEGLLAFFADVKSAEPEACEVLVASSEHGYAGRYDIRLRTSQPHDVVVHRTPKRGPVYRKLMPGRLLGDLKSSKGIYPTHHVQLAAYEAASVESGYGPTDAQAILHVSADGTYEFVRSRGELRHFLAVKAARDAIEEIKKNPDSFSSSKMSEADAV